MPFGRTVMPLFLRKSCFPVDFQEVKRPLGTKSVKRPIKVGKRPINEGKRPIKAKVLVGVAVGCLMGCFRAPPPWRKTAPLKRPIKRSMRKILWIFLSDLPGNLALKKGGDFWWIFSGLRFLGNEARKLLEKFGENSEQNSGGNSGQKFENFGELSFCHFSDLRNFPRWKFRPWKQILNQPPPLKTA